MRHSLATLILTVSVLAPQAVFAADEPDVPDAADYFGPLTLDLLVAGGLSSELYVHAEPSIDIGVARLGKTGAIGLGAGVDLGWCALCGLVSAFSDISWKGTYYAPFARGTIHAGALGGLLPNKGGTANVDLFVGALAGPSFYTFTIATDTATAEYKRVTVRLAPLIGARLGALNNRLLFFVEYRYNIEAGLTAVTYTTDSGEEQVIAPDTINRRGNEFMLGIGIRF